MTDIVIRKKNEAYIKVDCDASISHELTEYFTFDVPGARFSPAFKARKWDGKLRIFSYMKREVYSGLAGHIEKFAKDRDYSFENTIVPYGANVTREQIESFIESLDYHAHGKKIELRDYQVESIYRCIHDDRLLLVSPTSSGKSAMIGGVVRWHQSHDRRCLIIVPTTSLVSQMYGDLNDYFSHSGWTSADNCHKIMGGADKNHDKPITISTWQSLFKMDKEYFDQFDCVIVDECHLAKAKSITGIMEKCSDAPYRIGCTGTLDGTLTNKLVLIGLFGSVHQATTTKQLMENNEVANLSINCLILQYSDEEKKALKAMKSYQEEINFLVTHEKRNKFIRNLTLAQKGNTLVLFNLVEKHGKPLYELINNKAHEGRKVFLVYGGTEANEREEIRAITERETDAIIVASFGVFSTGVSIRNLHNVIFASPSKSRIRNLQSIGRGLRKSDTKDRATLYDISDDLSWKSHKNYTIKHAVERIKIYAEEGFDYKMVKVPLT